MVKVYFYIPAPELINQVPSSIQGYWEWINEAIRITPAKLASGELCTWTGPYNWTVQTFIHLRAYGFPCELTATLPLEGIIFAHTDVLTPFLKPSPKQFIVEIKPDKYLRCIYSNFVIVQSKRDPFCCGIKRYFVKSAHVNNWPQPGLIPRDPQRQARFENICFMGNSDEFLGEKDVLSAEIAKLGLRWKLMPREKWHDYSEADAVVAVRPVNSSKINRKPATRLVNAWLAGVPAILSPDVAFKDIRVSNLDYLEARNVAEVIEKIKLLMGNPRLRKAMTNNGIRRCREFSLGENIDRWISIIHRQIIPEYAAWKTSSFRRACLFSSRILLQKTIGIDSRRINGNSAGR